MRKGRWRRYSKQKVADNAAAAGSRHSKNDTAENIHFFMNGGCCARKSERSSSGQFKKKKHIIRPDKLFLRPGLTQFLRLFRLQLFRLLQVRMRGLQIQGRLLHSVLQQE